MGDHGDCREAALFNAALSVSTRGSARTAYHDPPVSEQSEFSFFYLKILPNRIFKTPNNAAAPDGLSRFAAIFPRATPSLCLNRADCQDPFFFGATSNSRTAGLRTLRPPRLRTCV